jgi:hypothetical protein
MIMKLCQGTLIFLEINIKIFFTKIYKVVSLIGNMLENIIYILILVAGFPAGLILSNMCEDEIKAWRKRLKIISIICFLLAFGIYFLTSAIFIYKLPVIVALFFIIITSLTIIWKAH